MGIERLSDLGSQRIATLVIGKNEQWKQEINLMLKTNQNFVSRGCWKRKRSSQYIDYLTKEKLSASCFDGYVFLDHISWDNFNESGDLKAQVEAFKNYTGYYPESVHVDQIYRTLLEPG